MVPPPSCLKKRLALLPVSANTNEPHGPGKPGPNLVLLGPPGAGKGSLAENLVSLNVEHVSSGQFFRREVASGSELGKTFERALEKGTFVSDEMTLAVMQKWFFSRKRNRGFLLDGFPRNLLQGKVFDEWLVQRRERLDAVLFLKLEIEDSVLRISQRRVCPVDGSVYHLTFNRPRVEGKCDQCGATLVQRSDDTEETVARRWKIFEENTLPLVAKYRTEGLLLEIDASQSIEKVYQETLTKLSQRDLT